MPKNSHQIGQALLSLGDLQGAKKELQAAIEKSTLMNLKYASTLHFFLAGIEKRLGEKEEAFKELRLSLQLEPEDCATNLTLGTSVGARRKSGVGTSISSKGS